MVKLPGSQIESEAASVHDMRLIKEVCQSHFRQHPAQFAKCMAELSALEAVTTTSEEICSIHPFPKCQRLVAICRVITDTQYFLPVAFSQPLFLYIFSAPSRSARPRTASPPASAPRPSVSASTAP